MQVCIVLYGLYLFLGSCINLLSGTFLIIPKDECSSGYVSKIHVLMCYAVEQTMKWAFPMSRPEQSDLLGSDVHINSYKPGILFIKHRQIE